VLCRAALVVEGDDTLGRPSQVGDDEADTRVKFARMPLDLGHDAARLVPALRLIAEAGLVLVAANVMRRSSDRALQQLADPTLQDAVGRQPDRVAGTLGFKELVHLGIEGRVAPEIDAPVARDHWFQDCAPTVGAVHVAGSEGGSLDIAELVEHKERMLAGTRALAAPSVKQRLAAIRHLRDLSPV
jgi:hypothetical protein